MKDRVRILVTHAMHVLKNVDQVVVLNEGKVHEVDTYPNPIKNESSHLNQLIVSVAYSQDEALILRRPSPFLVTNLKVHLRPFEALTFQSLE